MIKIYTMPKCSSCETYKRRLREWRIQFQELPLIHFQNLHPEKIWSAPILEVGDTIYDYESIGESRDKLWKATHDDRLGIVDTETIPDTPKDTRDYRKEVDAANKARAKKDKNSPQIDIDEEIESRVTDTMKSILGAKNPAATIELITNHMGDLEKFAFMLGYRLANHSNAITWIAKSDEFRARARTLDPYKPPECPTITPNAQIRPYLKIKWRKPAND